MRQLRDYQLEAVEAITDAWADGMLRPAIILPTGTGKTDVIAKIATDAASTGKGVLALAHRGELLDQITERCQMHRPDIPVGRVQAQHNQTRRPITVAMTPTLASDERRAKLPIPDVIIVDECHHAASPSQMAILRWGGSFDHTHTMGVTATLVRGDKRGLGDVWQGTVFERDIKWAIDAGWLVKPRGKVVVARHMDLNKAKVRKGDYTESELGEMVAQDVDQIAKAWYEHAEDRQTVAFTPNVASAQQLAEEFRTIGVPVGEVYGHTPTPERQRIYADLAAGRIRVLVSVMVTTEGWDCPPVSCILMARPTRLPGLYTQIVGRGLRPSPETGKTDCLVLDVVGASRHQKLVTLIDLHETAEIDMSELDELPCEECGGYSEAQRQVMGEELEACTCEEELEPGEPREPKTLNRLIGPAEYEDHDFFTKSELNWLFTKGGIRFLPVGERICLLWPNPKTGLYRAGHCTIRGYWKKRYVGRDGHWHPSGWLPLDEARQIAEEFALKVDPSLSRRGSSWRRGSPSQQQIEYALRLGIENPESMNKARVSDEINIALATKQVG